LTRAFIEFGYSEPAKAFQSPNFQLPIHEAIRAILLAGSAVYKDSVSVVGNPLDARTGRRSEQFLRLFIIQYLVNECSEQSDYISCKTTVDFLRMLGFLESTSLQVLRDLQDRRFIFSKSHNEITIGDDIYPTRMAGHFARGFLSKLIVIENLLMDTTIHDEKLWSDLVGLTERIHSDSNIVRKTKNRAKRSQDFYKYCGDELEKLCELARRHNFPATWTTNCLYDGKQSFEHDCSKAVASAENIYS
jgi:hypothetical protein